MLFTLVPPLFEEIVKKGIIYPFMVGELFREPYISFSEDFARFIIRPHEKMIISEPIDKLKLHLFKIGTRWSEKNNQGGTDSKILENSKSAPVSLIYFFYVARLFIFFPKEAKKKLGCYVCKGHIAYFMYLEVEDKKMVIIMTAYSKQFIHFHAREFDRMDMVTGSTLFHLK